MVKVPKYIEKELEKASNYANKVSNCIGKFEEWVTNNVDEDFDFDLLRDGTEDDRNSTDALSDVEYGNKVYIEEIERILNKWVDEHK